MMKWLVMRHQLNALMNVVSLTHSLTVRMENNSYNCDNGFNSPIYNGSKEEPPTLNQDSQQGMLNME